ncbi:MAG TPA: hypothetical protein VFC39_08790 [Acidobacteriaceae bacterium]|nr:hypothetical protein [Acidobacteriaceae bacterium]
MSARNFRSIGFAGVAGLMGLALLAGCKSKTDQAIDQAKAQAASTGVAQQVQYIDSNGDTDTITVTPPVSGQTQQVTTAITPAPPGPKPKATNPVVTPLGPAPAANGASTVGPASATDPGAPGAPGNAAAAQADYVAPPEQPISNNAPPVNVSVPAGTTLAIRINQHISVKHNHAGDRFSGEVVDPVEVNGNVVIPKGAEVGGRIDEAHRRGHFKGRSVLELRLTSIELNGNRYALDTHDNVHSKKGKGRRTGGFIGGMTGAGMLIGGLATGGVGLAIGGAAGAGAGTLIAGTTGNRDIEIPSESIVRFRLSDPLYVP